MVFFSIFLFLLQIWIVHCYKRRGVGSKCSLRLLMAPDVESVKDLKRSLLQSISDNDKSGIARATKVLECSETPIGEIDGTWSLVYSSNSGTEPIEGQNDVSFFDALSGNLYKLFFKFVPFLAGGQERMDGNRQNKQQNLSSIMPKVSNTQIIDLESESINNKVIVRPKVGPTLQIEVKGLVAPAKNENENSGSDKGDKGRINSKKVVSVVFTDFSLNGLRLPLPRPRGLLSTAFCDEDLRISRGGRGGLFVVKRIGKNS